MHWQVPIEGLLLLSASSVGTTRHAQLFTRQGITLLFLHSQKKGNMRAWCASHPQTVAVQATFEGLHIRMVFSYASLSIKDDAACMLAHVSMYVSIRNLQTPLHIPISHHLR